ncbi:hypothetical protein [Streptomyces flavalbus]|uniref:DUF4352 domain-containing protein n=1 Tax=Streptomyces flavalbus TaxID=2665155 RepID=A0ABW2WKD8_9ACTN
MTDGTPERHDSTPTPTAPGTPLPPHPAAPPPYAYPTATLHSPAPVPAPPAAPRTGRGALITIAVLVVLLLAGGGAAWWALANEGTDDGGPLDHVEVSGGKLVSGDDEECDDTDAFTYNDCDTYDSGSDDTYEFDYEITNKGSGFANYSVVVNAFDEDGDFIGQTYIGSTHLAAGKTDADEGNFNEYDTFEDGRDVTDIESVEVAYVERRELAN